MPITLSPVLCYVFQADLCIMTLNPPSRFIEEHGRAAKMEK